MVPEAGKWDPEEFYVEGGKDANMDVFLFFSLDSFNFSFVGEGGRVVCVVYS